MALNRSDVDALLETDARERAECMGVDTRLSIVLIDRRSVTRQCIVRWLEQDRPDFRIVAAGTVFEAARDEAVLQSADLIIFSTGADDVKTPKILDEIDQLISHAGPTPIVILCEREELDAMVEVIHRGVRGCIPTSLDLAEAAEAIRFVQAGGTYVPAQAVVRTMRHPAGSRCIEKTPFESLTPREREVLGRLRHGMPNKVIAHELNITESTVKVLVRRILRKLHAMNRTEVAYIAQQL
jgi:DNA-binding NarL/FixJ family response regulator